MAKAPSGQYTTLGCKPACSDGVDNDGDTVFDFPGDPGCANLDDNDETEVETMEGFETLILKGLGISNPYERQ